MLLSFSVHGRPQPQGSTRAFMPKGARFPVVTTDNASLKPWRQDVAGEALRAMGGSSPIAGPVSICCRFYFLKPKSTKASVLRKTTKPDLDKLERGIYDALTGIVFVDDSQIVDSAASKHFCNSNERVEIEVVELQ